MMIFAGSCTFLGFLFLPETFAPVLLARKAKRLRQANPAKNIERFAESERVSWAPSAVLERTIFRPFKMLLVEPILLLSTIYLSVAYGVIYASVSHHLCAAVVRFLTRVLSRSVSGASRDFHTYAALFHHERRSRLHRHWHRFRARYLCEPLVLAHIPSSHQGMVRIPARRGAPVLRHGWRSRSGGRYPLARLERKL